MAYRNYSTGVSHIVDPSGLGDFTTIQAAINAAVSGQTIFLRPGTYTENPVLKDGIDIVAFSSDPATPQVTIVGKCSFSSGGTSSVSNICFQTNADYFVEVTGASQCRIFFNNCCFNITNHTGINFTNSNASSRLEFNQGYLDFSGTGIAIFNMTSVGVMNFLYMTMINTAGTSTSSTQSAGIITCLFTSISSPITTSGTGSIQFRNCSLDTGSENTTALTAGSSGSHAMINGIIASGTAPCINVGVGASVEAALTNLVSSNTNVVTGLGLFSYDNATAFSLSIQMNPTTQTNMNSRSFTPVLAFGGASTGITYSTQFGLYNRVGNTVFFQISIILTSKGSSVGNATITGLPFPISSAYQPAFQAYLAIMNSSPATTTYNIATLAGSTLTLLGALPTGAAGNYTDANFLDTSQIYINGTYFI